MASSKNKSSHKNDKPKKSTHSHKKGKDIKPLNEDALKKQIQIDNQEKAKTNAEMLEELAKKTAELAEKVEGDLLNEPKVLKLDEEDVQKSDELLREIANNNLDAQTYLENNAKPEVKTRTKSTGANAAADLIREKLSKIYKNEPDIYEEIEETKSIVGNRSKHQEFINQLSSSGKSLVEIQTEWHEYYDALSNEEKHEVWQEFYQNQHQTSSYARHKHEGKTGSSTKPEKKRHKIQNQFVDKVNAGGKLKPIHHFKSALFGLGLAGFVGLVVTFLFFNEVFIAPFISPSSTVSATPIIGQVDGPVDPEPKIIIPKINLEVPVVFGMDTIQENAIQDALEDGVVHYATSPEPGEKGNSVIVGHSSNNILNSGKYKFAFVLLRRLEPGDVFFVHKDSVRYTYEVYEKRVVPPTETSVLGPASRENTMTLITCDPPGTSINRLIVVAEQVSPDPTQNTEASIDIESTPEGELPSNAPSLWSRITSIFSAD